MEIFYFKVPLPIYESVRQTMDQRSGFPNHFTSTWFTPGAECPKDMLDRDCLLATTSQEIISEFSNITEAQQITKEIYNYWLEEFQP